MLRLMAAEVRIKSLAISLPSSRIRSPGNEENLENIKAFKNFRWLRRAATTETDIL